MAKNNQLIYNSTLTSVKYQAFWTLQDCFYFLKMGQLFMYNLMETKN